MALWTHTAAVCACIRHTWAAVWLKPCGSGCLCLKNYHRCKVVAVMRDTKGTFIIYQLFSTETELHTFHLDQCTSVFLFFFNPDRRPEELLQFSPPRHGEAIHCVQQRGDCPRRQGDQGIVTGEVEGLCWIINQLQVPSLPPHANTHTFMFLPALKHKLHDLTWWTYPHTHTHLHTYQTYRCQESREEQHSPSVTQYIYIFTHIKIKAAQRKNHRRERERETESTNSKGNTQKSDKYETHAKMGNTCNKIWFTSSPPYDSITETDLDEM